MVESVASIAFPHYFIHDFCVLSLSVTSQAQNNKLYALSAVLWITVIMMVAKEEENNVLKEFGVDRMPDKTMGFINAIMEIESFVLY